MKTLSLIPHLSEKAYQTSSTGTYVFNVPVDAAKTEVAALVENKYNVRVKSVNILNKKGKKARSIRIGQANRAKRVYGTRPATKKAYVHLQKGDTIQIEAFSQAEESSDSTAANSKKKKS